MIAPSKLPAFAITFGLGVTILYTVLELMTWGPFTYFPASDRIAWGIQPASKEQGPAMYWYGWVLTALAGGLAAGLVATILPENLAKRISPNLLWLVSLIAAVVLAYGLRSYFTR
jgi:hypothetical protein